MKHSLYILILLLLSVCRPQSKTDYVDYAFQRGDKVYYHMLNSDSLLEINQADMPSVSPDGLKLAYRLNYDSSSSIWILDLTTNLTNEIKTPYTFNHSPAWNTDGSCLAFTSVTDRSVIISFLNKSGQLNSFEPPEGCIITAWACDNQTVILNNLDSLWYIEKSGLVRKSYNIRTVVKDKWIVVPSTIATSDNDRFLYFTAQNKESSCVSPPDGPSAIYRYDFKTDSTIKISGNILNCRDFSIQGSSIFISALKDCNHDQIGVYKYDNNVLTEVVKNGYSISTARKNSL